ncbi:hypothetical protein FXO37_16401 [Capsicum annuum]|nr:hypothetical protein FXO37_16401 [Capsicum annuum]
MRSLVSEHNSKSLGINKVVLGRVPTMAGVPLVYTSPSQAFWTGDTYAQSPYKDISNAEFPQFIYILAQLVASQSHLSNLIDHVSSLFEVIGVGQFMSLNSPSFIGYKVEEDLQGSIDKMKNIFRVMHATDSEGNFTSRLSHNLVLECKVVILNNDMDISSYPIATVATRANKILVATSFACAQMGVASGTNTGWYHLYARATYQEYEKPPNIVTVSQDNNSNTFQPHNYGRMVAVTNSCARSQLSRNMPRDRCAKALGCDQSLNGEMNNNASNTCPLDASLDDEGLLNETGKQVQFAFHQLMRMEKSSWISMITFDSWHPSATLYYMDLSRINLLPERGICLYNVLEKLSALHEKLEAIGLCPEYPCTHMITVPELCARIVACILDGIPLDVGKFVVNEIDHFQVQGDTHLYFPSLIIELCKSAGVEEYASDTWVCPNSSIFSLKIRGDSALNKSKKRNINLEKPACSEP